MLQPIVVCNEDAMIFWNVTQLSLVVGYRRFGQ